MPVGAPPVSVAVAWVAVPSAAQESGASRVTAGPVTRLKLWHATVGAAVAGEVVTETQFWI